MTFTVEDALISPQGLAILSGAGLIDAADKGQHLHATLDVAVGSGASVTDTITLENLIDELYLDNKITSIKVCNTIKAYATELDGSGAGVNYYSTKINGGSTEEFITVDKDKTLVFNIVDANGDAVAFANGATVKIDFYVYLEAGVTNVTIAPEDFGGFYYVEADTLFRDSATGKDMAATITIPKAKVQSAMTFTMASSGDPSTFTFTMDAFPAYTYFDRTKKVMCTIQIVGTDGKTEDENPHKPHSI